MSKNYNQLSSEQRYQIEALLQNEITQQEVARIIGVSLRVFSSKLADFVILDKNPLKVDPIGIKDIVVMETIKEGKTVYSRK